jgi:hypothetical protein
VVLVSSKDQVGKCQYARALCACCCNMQKLSSQSDIPSHLHTRPQHLASILIGSVHPSWPSQKNKDIHLQHLLLAVCRWQAMQCRAPAVLQLGIHIGPLVRCTSNLSCLAEVRRRLITSTSCSRSLAMASRGAVPSAAAATAQRDHHVSAATMPLDGFLQRIAECNCSAAEIAQLVPFVIDSDTGDARTLGRLTPE